MLGLLARVLGNAIIIVLAVVGADTISKRILGWKRKAECQGA